MQQSDILVDIVCSMVYDMLPEIVAQGVFDIINEEGDSDASDDSFTVIDEEGNIFLLE